VGREVNYTEGCPRSVDNAHFLPKFMRRVYLDHAATTPLDPRVLEVMLPWLKEHFGNASSVHALGRKARVAVEASREQVAGLLGAEPAEIIFTSGGSEANNAALKGLLRAGQKGLVTSTVEHEAILRPAASLRREGYPVTLLPPGPQGSLLPEQVAAALDAGIGLVSCMHANNETGAMADLVALAAVCRAHGALLHTDAVQTAGLARLDVQALGVDALSLSAHKFYGPKGVGALYLRGDVDFQPLVEGGAQERRRRAGTENVAALVGMAEALALAHHEAADRCAHLTTLRDRLVAGLDAAFGNKVILNTPILAGNAAPHIVNVAFPPLDGQGLDGEMLLLNLDLAGICASSGSACTSGAIEPSHVLLALGLPPETATAALRFSLGKDNTPDDIDYTLDHLTTVVNRMRRGR
jgi:cysteine desulfurase